MKATKVGGSGDCVADDAAKVDIWRGPFAIWGFSACHLCVASF